MITTEMAKMIREEVMITEVIITTEVMITTEVTSTQTDIILIETLTETVMAIIITGEQKTREVIIDRDIVSCVHPHIIGQANVTNTEHQKKNVQS